MIKNIACLISALTIGTFLNTCVEGETDLIAETVRAAELGIVSISLVKEHEDNLRAGRQLQVSAISLLESGETLDITSEVNWAVNDTSLFTSEGSGIFIAQAGTDGTAVITSTFAGINSETNLVVSTASLESLSIEAVNFAGSATVEMEACSQQAFTAKGKYEGEDAERSETKYVTWNGTNGTFSGFTFNNAAIDIAADPTVTSAITASLDGKTSGSIALSYAEIVAGTSLDITPSTEQNLLMGNQLKFSAVLSNASEDVSHIAVWNNTAVNNEIPSPSASFVGSLLIAATETEDVNIANNSDYSVNVNVSCSGLPNSTKVAINSDITDIEVSPSSGDINLDGTTQLVLTLNDGDVSNADITDADDITWELEDIAEDYISLISTSNLSRTVAVNNPNNTGADISFTLRVNYHGVEETFTYNIPQVPTDT